MAGADTEFRGTKRFEVVRRLGAGGMGVVYEAIDREHDTRVALKTLRMFDATAMDANLILRFKNEYRGQKDVQHPNLVSLGDLVHEDGVWFFTMELVVGVDFLAHVRPHRHEEDAPSELTPVDDESAIAPRPHHSLEGRVDLPRLRAALGQLASGLAALHRAHQIHRDVKPSNLLVTAEGRVVVLDFGLATRIAGDRQLTGPQRVGTADYMAPEQAGAKLVGPAGDWYSVGVMLYEALTGELPFRGSQAQVIAAKVKGEAPPPSAIDPTVPDDLDKLCIELLRRDPAARPSGDEILLRLGVDDSAHREAPASSERFVGRWRELEVLEAAFEEAHRGHGVTLLLRGESGVGKSALVREFTERATRRAGAVVLAGRCYQNEAVPYRAFDGVVDALARFLLGLRPAELSAILPPRAGLLTQAFPVLLLLDAVAELPRSIDFEPDPQVQRTRLFEALRELLVRLGRRRRLVLVIDDLQWADSDSLALLREVLRAPDAPPILLVAMLRGDAVLTAPPTADSRELRIDSLPRDQARELARSLLRAADLDDATCVRLAPLIAGEAAGHPLFIDELVRHAIEAGEARPLRLDEALWARIERLPPSLRSLLELCVVAGAPLALDVATRAADAADFTELSKRLAALRIAHLLRPRGDDAIEPYHDRVRDALLAHLAPTRKRAHHESLARAIEHHGGDAESLAIHWQGAGDARRAAVHFARAADAAAGALAFERAATLYRRALDPAPEDASERRALWVRLGDALGNDGRGGEAAAAYREATAGAPADEALDLHRRIAEQLLRAGHVDEGLAALTTLLETLGIPLAKTPSAALRELIWSRARLALRGLAFEERSAEAVDPNELVRIDALWSLGSTFAILDTIRGAHFQTRGLLHALAAGEPYRIARALAIEVSYVATAGGAASARTARLLAEASTLAERIEHPHAIALTVGAAGLAAFLEGRWKTARAELERADELLTARAGATWERHTVQLYGLIALTYLGGVGELARRVPRHLHDAEVRGDRYTATTVRTALPNLVWLAADDPARARAELEAGMRDWSREGFHLQHYWSLLTLGQIDLYTGAPALAYARIAEQWRALDRSLLLRIQVVRIEALFLRARTAIACAGDGGDAKKLLFEAERDARRIAREAMPWSTPIAQLLDAAIAKRRGDLTTAERLIRDAIQGFDGADMALFAAAARIRRGALLEGDEGRSLVLDATSQMQSEGIASPMRMAAMLAPGFS